MKIPENFLNKNKINIIFNFFIYISQKDLVPQ